MAPKDDILIQRISLIRDDKPFADFDLSFLKEVTLIESVDLSGPKFILSMDDPHGYLSDKLKIVAHDKIEVALADIWNRDSLDQVMRFTILTAPTTGRYITYNCFHSTLYSIKEPSRESRLFTGRPVKTIISKLLPGMKYEVGQFASGQDYHVLPGARPSKTLRVMAHEMGALCFIRRGTVVFKKMSELFKAQPKFEYHYNDSSKPNQIMKYERINNHETIKDATERNYIGWDMVGGLVKMNQAIQKPVEFVSQAASKALDNLVAIPMPAIDFVIVGDGSLVPGDTMRLVWNTRNPDAPIDESLPSKVLVSTVSNFYSGQRFLGRVKGVVI